MEVDSNLVHPMMRTFMYGQFANLFKFALWWVSLAPLTFAILDGSTTAIGVGRIVYNAALCLTSPIGGLLVERVHPKKILLRAAGVRFIIWCLAIPLSWVLFDSSLVTNSQIAIWIVLNVALFFDGISVGLSTVLDIDLCGVDVVANTYGLDVTDEHRNQFNSRQEFFFACCFVIFAPAMAFLGLAIHHGFSQAHSSLGNENNIQSGTLCAIFFATFLVATVLQFFFFGKLPAGNSPNAEENPSPQHIVNEETHDEPHALNSSAEVPREGGAGEEAPPSFMEQVKAVPSDLKGSLEVIWQNPPVLWRLVFLGFEIAFEDAAIVVIASQMGILLPWLGDGNSVHGNVWTAIAVAVGKLGGAIASVLMMKFYHPPEEARKFVPIFALITLSCVFAFGFPLITDGYNNGTISANTARGLFLLTFFCYFFVSTLPKLGLMCLFQSMVSQIENGPRVFGFIAIVATTFDGGVIMILSVLFVTYGISKALWITACVYMVHGVLELLVGPALVLRPLEAAQKNAGGGGDDHPETTSESTSLVTNVQQPGSSKPISLEEEEQEGTVSASIGAGTFTQRSAAVPVATPRSHSNQYGGLNVSNSLRGGRSIPVAASPTSLQTTAVMSTSMHGAHGGMVQRRRSNLDGPSPSGDYGSPGTRYTRHGSALTPRAPGSPRTPRTPRQ